MSRWWDVRCLFPAGGYKTGHCHGLLFRVNDVGDLELKCHRCHRVQTVTVDRYRVGELVST